MLYLGRDKAYLMPKRVFRGSEEQIFLSMLTRNLPQEREEEFEHDDRNKQPGRDVCVWKKLGMEAQAGQVYCLNGDLGVGKTVLRRGLPRDLEFRNRSTARLSRSCRSTTMGACRFTI